MMIAIMENINTEITKEDIVAAESMWKARQKGLYYNSGLVTQLYNKLYHTNLNPTSCGSCIRHRIDGIWKKIEEYKKITEPQVPEENNEKESGNGETSKGKVAKKSKKEIVKTDKVD